MSQTKDLDTRPAGQYAWAAARDAQRYSDECRMLYSGQKRARIETFLSLVQMAYSGVREEPTYRKNFATIKIAKGSLVRDRRMAREIQAICEERGYEQRTTPQGLIFRIPA
jgi:hypothetical protein